jgi:thiamine pyrophosphokinase
VRAVIFANGVFSHPDIDRARLRPDDWLIAADGGARHCQILGLTPAVLIGDFDSIKSQERQALEQQGVTMVPFPEGKDETDLELALRYAVEGGANEVLILAGMGSRWDQSLANLLLPAIVELAGVQIQLIDGPQEATLIRDGETQKLQGQPGDKVSLIPLGGDAHGVTTHGLEYPLHGDTLYFGATRGVSNVLLGEEATIHLERGMMACFITHSPQKLDV